MRTGSSEKKGHYEIIPAYDESRKYLYEYSYQKEAEYSDGKGIEESRYVFLSDKELQSDKEVQSEFEKMRSGFENDLVIVFSDFKRVG